MAARGRPAKYTKKLGEQICEKIAEDWTLKEIEAIKGFPTERTILRWALNTEKYPEFCQQYERAREIQGHVWGERLRAVHKQIPRISDQWTTKLDPAAVTLAKIESENLKWLMSKRLPKKYGDKPEPEKKGGEIKPHEATEVIIEAEPMPERYRREG